MAVLSLWTRPLLAGLPGATPVQIEEKLRHAMKEFYLQSRAWRRVLGPLDVTINAPLVSLNPVDVNTQVVWVRRAWLQEGGVITNLKPAVVKVTETRVDKPSSYYHESPSSLTLWPTPSATLTGVLFVEAALTLADAATVIPDISATHHFEAIYNGALARLLAMPNKPWTDQAAATTYGRMFRRSSMELRAVSDAGYTHSDPPWKFPSFA